MYLDNIYVINLEHCVDRKKHIQKEFKRVGINKYEFFKGINKDSQEVKDMMESKFVKKFPPCFRCGKNKCGCPNNILINSQIGNWCSFINIMKKIIEKDYKKLIMICEDDIKIRNMNIIRNIISLSSLKKYGVNLNKPILIRLASNAQIGNGVPQLIKNKIIISNPAFIVNKKFAESFIKNLKRINVTSDTYIHRRLVNLDKSIQHYTLFPIQIYELSSSQQKIFPSEIHPKGLDQKDKIRMRNHIKKVIFKKFLCIGENESDVKKVKNYLTKLGYKIGYNQMKENGICILMSNKNNFNKFYFANIIHIGDISNKIKNRFKNANIIIEDDLSILNKFKKMGKN